MPRFKFISLAAYIGFLVVLCRLAYLQIWCHEFLLERSVSQTERLKRPLILRGAILDRNGVILANSVAMDSCFADPGIIKNVRYASEKLAPVLQMPAHLIAQRIKEDNSRFVWLKRHLTAKKEIIDNLNIAGIGFMKEEKRVYPEGNLAINILGLVGKDSRGLSGAELFFNSLLSPKIFSMRLNVDGKKRPIIDVLHYKSAQYSMPRNLYLTIDRNLQYVTEKELEAGRSACGAKSGLAIIQDPFSGEILAIASTQAKESSITDNINVKAITDTFEPGSTFKIVTLSAALENGSVSPKQTVWCENGSWQYADVTIHDHEPQGMLTVQQVLERSSNIGCSKIALGLNKEYLYRYIKAFGFGTKSGLKFPGESPGLLKKPDNWSKVSPAMISFGQEIGATAIQVIGAYSTIANGGTLLEPSLVRKVADENWKTIWEHKPVPIRQVVSPQTAETIKLFLSGAVKSGTGVLANINGISVAGKTGTAQKIDPLTRKYSGQKLVSSFCGFLPAGLKTGSNPGVPKVVIYITYDEPKGPGWGGVCAAPVFKKLAEYIISYYGIPINAYTPTITLASTK